MHRLTVFKCRTRKHRILSAFDALGRRISTLMHARHFPQLSHTQVRERLKNLDQNRNQTAWNYIEHADAAA